MSIAVFWIDEVMEAQHQYFADADFVKALKVVEEKRKMGYEHVCMSTQLAGNIGKPGVSSVENGKTPDGHNYEWSKKHRGQNFVSK